MFVRANTIRRLWRIVFFLVGVLTIVGFIRIPADADVAIRWSWGDWEPTETLSKPFALLVIPLATVIAFFALWARREDLEYLGPFTAGVEVIVLAMLLAAQTSIVLYAI